MSKNKDPELLDEQAPKKKTIPKKAATTGTTGTTRKKAAPKAEAAKPAKRAPRKKAVAAPDEAAPAAEGAPARAAAPAAESTPAPAPAPVEVIAAPAPISSPAPAAHAPSSPDAQRPRPLYIPREVEAFLHAAHIPIPTEKGQLDAIMSAMHGAKMAAQQAFAAPAPAAAPQAESSPPAAQPAQPAPQQQPRGRERHERQPRPDHRQHRRDQQQQHNQQREQNREPSREQNREPQESAPPAPQAEPELEEIVDVEGYCEISGKGFGFLRDASRFFQPHPSDVFVTPEAVKKYGLRDGQWLKAEARKSHRGLQIHRILTINDADPEAAKAWPAFDDLTSISPLERMKLETEPDRFTTRIIDLVTPVGKGQRGLIVAPPRTGKTTLLHHIAQAVVKNHPDVKLMILLVDERPEEVTDFKRNIPEAELWAS